MLANDVAAVRAAPAGEPLADEGVAAPACAANRAPDAASVPAVKRLLERMLLMVATDELTELPTRGAFWWLASEFLLAAAELNQPSVLLYVGVDGAGHAGARDPRLARALLRRTSLVLQRALRGADPHVIARVGEREFAVLCREAEPCTEEWLRRRLAGMLAHDNAFARDCSLVLQVGSARAAPPFGASAGELLERAFASAAGRGCLAASALTRSCESPTLDAFRAGDDSCRGAISICGDC